MLLAFTSQVAGYLLISFSLPRLPAVMTSLILMVQPVTTVFLGAALLGEAPSGFQLAGVGLVVGGLLVANLRRRTKSDRPVEGPAPALASSAGWSQTPGSS